MTSNPLFHVEHRGFDSPRLHQHKQANQRLADWAIRQLGLQSAPVVRPKATSGQPRHVGSYGLYSIIEVREKGKPSLRYVKEIP